MSKVTEEVIGGEIVDRRTNPFLGIIGALVGALIGAALWIILYQIGIIASIAGVAIVYLACKGYAMLSKSDSLGGVVIAITIAVVVLLGTHFLCWGLMIHAAFEGDLTLLESILMVPEVAFTDDLIIDFVKELLIGLVLIIVGAMPFIRQAAHRGAKSE